MLGFPEPCRRENCAVLDHQIDTEEGQSGASIFWTDARRSVRLPFVKSYAMM